jgi:hypothetical protein
MSGRRRLFICVRYCTKPCPLRLMLILCLVLRLRGGGYPQYILDKAAELDNNNETIETKFYPLYDKILNYWFPPTEGYDVCPHWSIPEYRKTEDPDIAFVIEHHRRPFLLVEIKPPSDFRLNSGRGAAIFQVIQRLDEIGPTNQHADRLYAISAIGKRWRACYALKGNGSNGGRPVKGVAEVNSLKSTKPECWNADITLNTSWAALQKAMQPMLLSNVSFSCIFICCFSNSLHFHPAGRVCLSQPLCVITICYSYC